MMLDGAAPPSLEPADPTWYLILDLVGTWLGAIGTLAATGIAVALAVRAARDQRAQRDEQQRIQAERVVVLRVTSASRPYLLLRNESGQTINTVRAYAVGVPIPNDFSKMPSPVEVLRSGQEKKWYLRGVGDRRNTAVVEFDDALGRTWVRTAEGALHRTHRLSGVNTSVKVEATLRVDERIVSSIALHTQPGGKLLGLVQEPSSLAWGKHAQVRWLGGDPLAHLTDAERKQMADAENAVRTELEQLFASTAPRPEIPVHAPHFENYETENGRTNVSAYVRDLELYATAVGRARQAAPPGNEQ